MSFGTNGSKMGVQIGVSLQIDAWVGGCVLVFFFDLLVRYFSCIL
jgi:hypothetical protein